MLALFPVLPLTRTARVQSGAVASGGAPDSFPAQDPAVVREMVAVSHGNVARVRELVSKRPALARAAWDWGYGDWETALGAASHVGNREIAGILVANGAHPTIFSAAMLGQLEVVKSFVAAAPGIQRTRGPHGITLLAHASAGGGGSAEVVKYLESLGDADRGYTNLELADSERAALVGAYTFGSGPTERLTVSETPRGGLTIKREGAAFDRGLSHHGSRVFNPMGAEAVVIRFEPASGRASTLVVEDGDLVVHANRE
jgi:hypothetical protein